MHKSRPYSLQIHLGFICTLVLLEFGQEAGAVPGKACLSDVPLILDLYSPENRREMEERYFNNYIRDLRSLIRQGFWKFITGYRRVYRAYRFNRRRLSNIPRGSFYPFKFFYDMLMNPGIYKAKFIGMRNQRKVDAIVDEVVNRNGGCIEVNNINDLSRKEIWKLYTVPISEMLAVPKLLDACITVTSYLAMLARVNELRVPEGFDWSSMSKFFLVMFFGLMFWVQCLCYHHDVEGVFRQNFFVHVHAAQILQRKVANEQDLKRRIAQNEEMMRLCRGIQNRMNKIGPKEQQALINAFEGIDIALDNAKRKKPFAWKSLATMVMAFSLGEIFRCYS